MIKTDIRPRLYMLCGISGSGKTTFAKKLARERELQYICPDDFYKTMNGDERLHINEFDVWISIFRALHLAEEQNRSCVFDTNNPTLVSRVQILDWFPGFEPHLIYIHANEALCRFNNANRRRRVPPEEMDRMIAAFQPPRLDEDARYASITFLENEDNSGYVTTAFKR